MSDKASPQYQAVPDHEEPNQGDGFSVVVNTNSGEFVLRPWHYSLFTLCYDCNSFMEAWLCTPCQQSRQFNMLFHQEAELHVPLCLSTICFAGISGLPVLSGVNFILRSSIRHRYAIEGSHLLDCLVSYFCLGCAIQQQYLEMTSVGSCPSMSLCCVEPEPTVMIWTEETIASRQ